MDFDFIGTLGDEATTTAATPETAPPAASPMHAGFIVQHQGKLERVVAWGNDELVAGRAADCDVLLGADEVSRRHARFERAGNRYEVSDLGSVNGTFVNGRRVERQALEVGDVVQIEGFKLTFVLDGQPIDEMVAPPVAPAAAQSTQGALAMTMLQEEMPHRPGLTELLARPRAAEAVAPPASAAPVEVVALPVADLFAEESARGGRARGRSREAGGGERGAAAPLVARDLGTAPRARHVAGLDERELVFELRVRVAALPPALREALEAVDISELVLPAALHLKP